MACHGGLDHFYFGTTGQRTLACVLACVLWPALALHAPRPHIARPAIIVCPCCRGRIYSQSLGSLDVHFVRCARVAFHPPPASIRLFSAFFAPDTRRFFSLIHRVLYRNLMDKIRQTNHSGSEDLSLPVPSLALNDLSFPIAATVPHLQLTPLPRFPTTTSSTRRKQKRPSTAHSAQEKISLLPSSTIAPYQSPLLLPQAIPTSESDQMSLQPLRQDKLNLLERSSMQELSRNAHATVASLRTQASRFTTTGKYHLISHCPDLPLTTATPHSRSGDILPSPFDHSPSDDQLCQSISSQAPIDDQVEYDWATFINAYSLGRWDPLKTPRPPRSCIQVPALGQISQTIVQSPNSDSVEPLQSIADSSEADDWVPEEVIEPPSIPSGYEDVVLVGVDGFTLSAPPQFHVPSAVLTSKTTYIPSILPDTGISKLADRRTSMPLHLGTLNRMRNSFADFRSPSSSTSGPLSAGSDPSRPPHTDVTTSAAAIRWAAAHVSVAPLALPSPEHELTDPMRGVTATIPGSHPPDLYVRPDPAPTSPTSMRKSRLSSFWQGTQDIEDPRLPPVIQASPSVEQERDSVEPDPGHDPGHNRELEKTARSMPFISTSIVPATAPVRLASVEQQEDDDYFGSGLSYDILTSTTTSEQPSLVMEASGCSTITTTTGTSTCSPELDLLRQSSAPLLNGEEPITVPALPRRICLTRQTSAPLPTVSAGVYERRRVARASHHHHRPSPDGALSSLAVRAAKEEQMFNELGYLTPPNPPDELERRRALYK